MASVFELVRNFPARFRRRVSQGEYRPEIDGLRFFAIAFVILGHGFERADRFFASWRDATSAAGLAGRMEIAPAGVFLFFTVSGFILASQALKADADPLSPAFLKSYFGRRILRIEPPYILLLLATWLLLTLTHYTPEGTHRFFVAPASINLSLIGSLFYLHELLWGTFPRLFPPGWSLEVEVQFYILAPLLFAIWAGLRGVSARAGLTVLVLAIGLGLSFLGADAQGSPRLHYSLLHNINYFWIGIVIAYAREPMRALLARAPAAAATALGWAGIVGLALASSPDELAAPGPEALRLVAMYACLVAVFASAFDPRSGFRRFCAAGWVSLLGGACYSLYLVHIQIMQTMFAFAFKAAPGLPLAGVLLLFPLCCVAVAAAGLVYYVQIERRFMARDWPQRAMASLRRLAPRAAYP